jgi:hypothetical protein
MSDTLDPDLRQYCNTPRQFEIFDAVIAAGSNRQAAELLGCARTNVDAAINRIKSIASQAGYAPGHFTNGVAPGYRMGKVTVQRGAGGDVERVWERQIPGWEDFRESLEEFKDALLESVSEYALPSIDSEGLDEDIIPWFQIGDAHLGMVAYMMETGSNFDLDIAVRELRAAFKMLLAKAPKAKRCVINDLGDFTHYENFAAQTERGKHQLDVDTRYPKMIRVYARIWRELIELALERYETVDIIINQGNHSRTNDIWASTYTELFGELIEARYGRSGRVNVLNNDSVYIGYLMGDTFVMVHHSDKCSGEKLVDVMFKDFFEAVKQARHLYIDTGHVHHKHVKKERGVVLLQSWNNLAPNDKHHHDAGYRSRQSMSVAIRSRKYGEIGQHTIPVQMVWDAVAKKGKKSSSPTEKRHFKA